MRIGIMLRHLHVQRGGIGTYSRNIVNALIAIDRGHRYFLLYQDRSVLGRFGQNRHVIEVCSGPANRFLWDQIAVWRAARRYRFDVVLNLKYSVPLFGPGRRVCVIHGADWFVLPEGFPLSDRIYRALIGPLYWRRADAIISISQDATRHIVRRLNVDPHKVVTIPYGRDPAFQPIGDARRLEAVRRRYGLPERFFLFVGQFYELKNLDRLVAAFRRIRDRIAQRLVIVGEDRWGYLKRKGLEGLEREAGIVMPGWVERDDLVALYNLADAYVFPSLYEGFGIPLLEAMACGCPVVSSKRGAIPEVVGDAALLVDPLAVDDIAQAMYRVATSAELRERLRNRGLERVQAFSWQRCAERTLRVLEDVVRHGHVIDRPGPADGAQPAVTR